MSRPTKRPANRRGGPVRTSAGAFGLARRLGSSAAATAAQRAAFCVAFGMALGLGLGLAPNTGRAATPAATAKEAVPLADNPEVERRLIAISEELRCLVCQNESLAGSRAELAQDLRREVRALISAGQTDQQVKDFLVSRYGDFVLYRPQVKPITYLLWAGPFGLLAAGLFGLYRLVRARAGAADDGLAAPLSDAERHQAEALLKGPAP